MAVQSENSDYEDSIQMTIYHLYKILQNYANIPREQTTATLNTAIDLQQRKVLEF